MNEHSNELNFFGVTLKVKSSKLAAVLNSNVTDDVVVVARRARREGEALEAPSADSSTGETTNKADSGSSDEKLDKKSDEAANDT